MLLVWFFCRVVLQRHAEYIKLITRGDKHKMLSELKMCDVLMVTGVYHRCAVVVFVTGGRDTRTLRQTAETLIQLKPKIPLQHLAEHLCHQTHLLQHTR